MLTLMFFLVSGYVASSQPAWTLLEGMSNQEKENSLIEILLVEGATSEEILLKEEIENLWNEGEYDASICLFPVLEEMTGHGIMDIAVQWKEPIVTPQPDWGTDVLVSDRCSVYDLAYDVDNSTGALMAAVLSYDQTNHVTEIRRSTDAGNSWVKTCDLLMSGDQWRKIGVAFCDSHFYLVFNTGTSNEIAMLIRYKTADGSPDTFNNGTISVTINTSTDQIDGLALVSDVDGGMKNMYFASIEHGGRLRVYLGKNGGIDWTEDGTTIATNAHYGLDLCYQPAPSAYRVFVSYFDNSSTDRTVYVKGRISSINWDDLTQYNGCGGYSSSTAITAWKDTILCVFEYNDSIRYIQSWQGGTNWHWGKAYSNPAEKHRRPDVISRGGGGQAIVYNWLGSSTELRFALRDYGSGYWNNAVNVADHWSHTLCKPCVQYLGGGEYGVLYAGEYSSSGYGAYFDKTSMTSVGEQPVPEYPLENNFSVHNAEGFVTVNFSVLTDSKISIEIFDVLGRKVTSLANQVYSAGSYSLNWNLKDSMGRDVATGMYFVSFNASGASRTKTVSIY